MNESRPDRSDAVAVLRETLRELTSGAEHTPELGERLRRLAPAVLLDASLVDDVWQTEILGGLCTLATSERAALRALGQDVVFSRLVEPLSDSFTSESVDRYDRIFARLVTLCRRLRGAASVDAHLNRFGIRDERDLLARRARLRRPTVFRPSRTRDVTTVCILSRVTLGAEVAITSLIAQKIQKTLPHARVVLLAPEQIGELFGGDERLTVEAMPYPRRGGLLDRLESWIDLTRTLDRHRHGLRAEEFLVVDPDSRATQLGLLPVTEHDAGYHFFESRSFQRPGLERLGELTVAWLAEVFGPHDAPLYPRVSLRSRDLERGRALAEHFLDGGDRPAVSVNFGVGGNPRKRAGEDFEVRLASRILDEGGQLILDKGIGEERERANRLLATLRACGRRVIEVTDTGLADAANASTGRCDVLAWEGGIGGLGALVAASDLYVGYDSAFQHIAAALEVPVVDIFVDTQQPVFMRRWQPYSRAAVRTVTLDGACAAQGQGAIERGVTMVVDVSRQIWRRPLDAGSGRGIAGTPGARPPVPSESGEGGP